MVNQIALMRYQHVSGEATVDGDPEMTRGRTNILITDLACGALPATIPRVDRNFGTWLCWGVGADAVDDAGNLVSQCKGQGAAGADIQFLAAAKQEVAVLHMQVGMADATPRNADKDFRSLRSRRVNDGFAKRCAICNHGLAGQLHQQRRYHTSVFDCSAKISASATKPSTGISSARAVGSMFASASSAPVSTPNVFKLCRSIFRRCPKAASVMRCNAVASHGGGS